MCELAENTQRIYNKIIADFSKELENPSCLSVKWIDFLPISSIDGIGVQVYLEISKGRTSSDIWLEFIIRDTWKHESIHRELIRDYETLHDFLVDRLPILKYNYITNELHCEDEMSDYNKNILIGYELLKEMPTNDNVKSKIQECSVCMEMCNSKTSCYHQLCKKCEYKIKDKKCPICRSSYNHYLKDMEEEDF